MATVEAIREPVVDESRNEALPITRWAALVGRWDFDGNSARYRGGRGAEGNGTEIEGSVSPTPYGVSVCPVVFRDGCVSAEIQLNRSERTTGGVVLGFKSTSTGYLVAGLGAFDYAYSVTRFNPERGFELVDGAGSLRNLARENPHSLEVTLDGQVVRLTVDSVPVLETVLRTPLVGSGLGIFAYDDSPVEFNDLRVRKDHVKVFVMMPFREPFDTLYEDVIRPEAEHLGFEIVRVDEIAGPGLILEDIRRQIERSHIVVAEISTPNPNVFYELGYAHALSKPAVLLVRRESEKEMPFDIRPYRAIFYDDSIGGKKHVQAQLRSHLLASLGAGA